MAHAAKQQEGLQGLVWVMLFPLPGRERGRVRVDEPALSPREAGARDVLESPTTQDPEVPTKICYRGGMSEEAMAERNENVVALNVKLTPVENSDQPVSVNYTTVGVAQGIAYLDFGFIEPAMLAMLARTARDGKTIPDSLDGKLVVRVAMGLDVLQRLHQQIQHVLIGLRGKREAKQ